MGEGGGTCSVRGHWRWEGDNYERGRRCKGRRWHWRAVPRMRLPETRLLVVVAAAVAIGIVGSLSRVSSSCVFGSMRNALRRRRCRHLWHRGRRLFLWCIRHGVVQAGVRLLWCL